MLFKTGLRDGKCLRTSLKLNNIFPNTSARTFLTEKLGRPERMTKSTLS
jgi:hypothetical protein